MLLKLDVDYDYALQAMTHYSERKKAKYVMNLTNKSWFCVIETNDYNIKSYTITIALNEIDKEVFLHAILGGESKTLFKYKYNFNQYKMNELLEVLKKYDLAYEILD